MTLNQGEVDGIYRVLSDTLPFELKQRMASLGMIRNSLIRVVHRKRNGTAVVILRGSRFAVGRDVTSRIEVEEIQDDQR